MKTIIASCKFQIVLTAVVFAPAVADETFYLQRGSTWKYLPGTQEASSPDTAAMTSTNTAEMNRPNLMDWPLPIRGGRPGHDIAVESVGGDGCFQRGSDRATVAHRQQV